MTLNHCFNITTIDFVFMATGFVTLLAIGMFLVCGLIMFALRGWGIEL